VCFAEIVAWQPPGAGSRPVPIGSRFIGASLQPAIPRRVAPQQSPLPLHQSPTILAQSDPARPSNAVLLNLTPRIQLRPCLAFGRGVVHAANRSVISTLRTGCHFYLAPTIGRSRFHAAEFNWRPAVLVEIGENRRGLDGL